MLPSKLLSPMEIWGDSCFCRGMAIAESKIGWRQAQAVGLSASEWEHLVSVLEREPSFEELQMIGVMWSEHCSYKSSKRHLKRLITKSESVLQGPGENAGLVRLDEKRAIAFKVESHNHPSYVEAFQGAATGVGGILRDIFTMGARPIALGNYLRFGPLNTRKQQHLLNGVVSGIAHYGNCMGIPTLGGQIHTDECYESNILVNVFAMGLMTSKKVFLSNTAKPGQSVMLWGARTGRDGIHGASLLASADFEENKTQTKEQKIRVQVGDPFKEKCLMEATLECMDKLGPKIGAIQDMGAAGLTCSTLEISDKSKIGMKINLNLVPMREEGMEAFELLLSESQERMLAVVEKGSEREFIKILEHWGCEASVIGETILEPSVKMSFNGDQIVNLPVEKIIDAPPADLPEVSSEKISARFSPEDSIQLPEDIRDEWKALLYLLGLPRIASKRNIFEQYDSSVGASTIFGPDQAEAAVLWAGSPEHPHMGVAYKGACDESLSAIDPNFGMQYAMAEAYRALACVGAEALAITDGVNMGNPHTQKVQDALSDCVDGINSAIEVFGTACVSGNVSLYNQTLIGDHKRDIKPTVFVVMVGKIEDVRKSKSNKFQEAGNEVWLLEVPGSTQALPFGSAYAREFWREQESVKNFVPFLDLQAEKHLKEVLIQAHEKNLFVSCRDVGDGGLAVSLAEACFNQNECFGFEGDWSKYQNRRDYLLFGEHGGRVVVEIKPANRAELIKHAMKWKIEAKRIGSITKEKSFRLRPLLSGNIQDLYQAWTRSLGEII